jgi:hypothetical protein
VDPGGPVCFPEPSSPEAMRWAFPPFVDLGKLRADGWEPTSEERTGFDLPAPRSLEGAVPERIWGEGPVTWWRRTVRWEGGWVERAWMAISEDGQLRAVRQERREAGGQWHSDEERVYGPVWVLRPDPRGELLLQPSPEMARICESEKGKNGRNPMRPRLIAAVIGVSALTLILIPGAHAQSGWSSWSCQWTVSNVPVPGGVLSGRGCAPWWTASGPPSWRIWGDT